MVQSNHSALGEGLRLYTSAMSRFVKQRLEVAFDGEWWEKGVIETITYLRRHLPNDMAKNPKAEKREFLVPGMFIDIITRNHALFRDAYPNRREAQSLLVQVSEARNRWAHSLASSDMTEDDVVRALMSMEKLLSDAGLPEAREVKKLRRQVMGMPEPTPPRTTTMRPLLGGERRTNQSAPQNATEPKTPRSVSRADAGPEPKVRKKEPDHHRRATLTEVVRQEVIEHWFTPARSRGKHEVTVAARDVNKWLGWSQRYPSICSALSDNSGELARRANVQLIRSTRPNPSSTTTFVYRLL